MKDIDHFDRLPQKLKDYINNMKVAPKSTQEVAKALRMYSGSVEDTIKLLDIWEENEFRNVRLEQGYNSNE